MKIRAMVVYLAVAAVNVCFSGAANAATWKYVGKMDLASGEVWTAYVDTDSVSPNKQAGTVNYWVRFEFEGKNASLKKLVKYETKRDYTEKTRYLEFHAYYPNGSVMTEGNTPEQEWQSVDEETLLRGALNVVYDVLDGKMK